MSATQTPLDELRQDMERNHLIPLWELEAEIMGLVPKPRTQPWLWHWDDLYGIAERAGELVPVERGGDRRAIALRNPGQDGMPYATSTLWAAVQWLNGREIAPAHRHTLAGGPLHHRRRRLLQHGRGRQGLPRARRPRADPALDVARPRQRVRRARDLDGRARHPAQQLPRCAASSRTTRTTASPSTSTSTARC